MSLAFAITVGLAMGIVFGFALEKSRVFEPGMVLTVEPGIYIPAGTRGVPKRWWNIGVRIEDDVLVTTAGHELLTAGLPRTPAEIERVMAPGPRARAKTRS